ncbi:recombinase family protein [Desulfuromusa kysingii]
MSGVKSNHSKLSGRLDYFREGDIVICYKLDIITRATKHLLSVVDQLQK